MAADTLAAGKALTIRMPYAWLVAKGIKDVENRGRRTAYRGPIYIHVSKTFTPGSGDVPWYLLDPDQVAAWVRYREDKALGCIIGQATLSDCVYRFPNENANLYSPWHQYNRWGWVLEDAQLFPKPVPARGMPGIFDYVPANETIGGPQ